jgi:transposase
MNLSKKEARRVFVMERLLGGGLTVPEAARILGVSERQLQRLKKEVSLNGIEALAHKGRGKKPKHALSQEERGVILEQATTALKGASYAHMAELLRERHQIQRCAKTIGRLLKEAGIKHPHTHKAPRRFRRRERMKAEGMLLQIDASPHDWLEGRGSRMSLHGVIDDATSKVVGLYFRLNEDATGYFEVIRQVLSQYGVPQSLYSDRHTIFKSPKDGKLTIEEELAGRTVPLTQFGRALEELGIRHISARTPQAKGRIERLWGTLQDRLVIEMRLAGIQTLQEANAFLPDFIRRHNERFAIQAVEPQAAYAPKPRPERLKDVLCFQHTRKVGRDSTISFEGTTYALEDSAGVAKLRAGYSLGVLCHLDGSLSARWETKKYALKPYEVPEPLQQTEPLKKPHREPYRPPASHPWKKAGAAALKLKEAKANAS